MEIRPICSSCTHWDASRGNADGLCRYEPPKHSLGTSSGWWSTAKDDWCSKHPYRLELHKQIRDCLIGRHHWEGDGAPGTRLCLRCRIAEKNWLERAIGPDAGGARHSGLAAPNSPGTPGARALARERVDGDG